MNRFAWPLAAVTEAAAEVERWFDYPLIRLGEQTITVLTLAKVLFWIVAILVLNRVFQRLVFRRLLSHTRLAPGLQFAIAKIVGYLTVGLGIYFALVTNGVNLSSLAVLAGALGLGIGFGLQNVVANFVSGLVLLTERPIAVGDRIEVEGVAGHVAKISLRATTVVTNDNISIIVPNLQLTSNPVTNWSHGGPLVRIRLSFGVAYGTNTDQLRRAMLAVAAAHPDVLSDPAPALYFDGFGESSLDFELAVWTRTMTQRPRRFRSDLNYMIEAKLREEGIEIPFPQRVVHVRRSAPEAFTASDDAPRADTAGPSG